MNGLLRFVAFILLSLLLVSHADAQNFLTLDKAVLTAQTEKSGITNFNIQALPWKWDSSIKRQGGVLKAAFYFSQTDLTPRQRSSAEPLAVYALNIGNRYRYALNDQPWGEVEWTRATSNYRARPQWFLLDRAYLRKNNTLHLELVVEANNYAGLTPIEIGLARDIRGHYQDKLDARNTYALAMGTFGLLVGFLALAMWLSLRDSVYLWAFFLLTCFAVRYLTLLIEYPPIPTRVWNWLMMSFFPLSSVATMLLSLKLAHEPRMWLYRLGWGLFVGMPLALFAGMLLEESRFYTVVLGLLIGACALYVSIAFKNYLRDRQFEVLMFCLAATGTLLFGVYDFVVIQISPQGLGNVRLSPIGNFLFAFVIGAVIVYRYTKTSRALIASKLEAKWEAVAATRHERHRIMNELHDTVGTQLTGLASLVRSDASKETLEEHTRMAIDDLRIAVNSLQAVDSKLDVALASFRRVIQPRLDANGIKLIWRIEELPELASFGSDKVLQLQKILQEAFANVLKHSEATEVVFSAKPIAESLAGTSAGIYVEITDNGKGFDPSRKTEGMGLNNMQVRAQNIGTSIRFESQPNKGTKIVMVFGA